MTQRPNIRRVVLTSEQRAEATDLMALGYTWTKARYDVMTPEQREEFKAQVRCAEAFRKYVADPYREIINRARHCAESARRRGAKRGAWEFTVTQADLVWPRRCPVFPWLELHYPGRYQFDPAAASLDRINNEKGYVRGNVRVISLRANVLRRDMTRDESRALAEYLQKQIDDFAGEPLDEEQTSRICEAWRKRGDLS